MPQRSDSPGSGSPVCCGCEKDAFAEQGELGSSEHLAFDHLDVIDAALDGAGVPACTQALEHGIPILLQTGGEGMQSRQVLGADGDAPVFEVLTGAGLKDLCEAADVPVEGLQLRAVEWASRATTCWRSPSPKCSGCRIIQPVIRLIPGGAGGTTRMRRRRLGRR
jgi:hypothetical protein